MSVKENLFNDSKKRSEMINRCPNRYTTQHLTSVDIEEVLKVGGFIVKVYEGFICDTLDFKPFDDFVIDMTEKRNKFKKEEKGLSQTLRKNKPMLFTVVASEKKLTSLSKV